MIDKRNIEAIYPLSPLQSAFLFQSMDVEHQDTGHIQTTINFEGELNKQVFNETWKWIIQLHPVLRTSIHWKELEKPLQVVHRQCDFEVSFEHIIDKEKFLVSDLNARFDLSQAPLQRITVHSIDTLHHQMYWRCHHILLDGWSESIILQQFMKHYQSIIEQKDQQPEVIVPYQAWIKHISTRNETEEQNYWLQELKGASSANQLWPPAARKATFNSVKLILEPDFTTQLIQQIRSFKSTIGLTMQLIWAVVLAQTKQSDDVIFGATLSGRSTALHGIESMVGLFVNSLPVRVQINQDSSILELLQLLQKKSLQRSEHEHISLADLYRWNCLSGQQPFDSLLVIENFPWPEQPTNSNDLRMTSFSGDMSTHYPLTLVVMPGNCLNLQLYYMEDVIEQSAASQILDLIQDMFQFIVENPSAKISELYKKHTTEIIFQSNLTRGSHQSRTRKKTRTNQSTRQKSIEDALLNVWQETLKVSNIDTEDNFFDLGGNSFLGLVLIENIRKKTGRQLPLATLFMAPTINKMITILEKSFDRLPGSSVIPISTKGDNNPFFMVHGGNWIGSILASHLDEEQPLYLIDAHWDYADINTDAKIEYLAKAAIEDMLTVQPKGPWFLGGYSMGTLIVYEMAQQLQMAGERVDLLFMLDPPMRTDIFHCIDGFTQQQLKSLTLSNNMKNNNSFYTGKRLVSKIQVLMEKSTIEKINYLHDVIKSRYIKLKKQIFVSIAKIYDKKGKSIPVKLRVAYVEHAYGCATSRYTIKPYNGSLVIFTNETYPEMNLWDLLAKNKNEIVKFECEHIDFCHKPELIHQWSQELTKILMKKSSRGARPEI